MEVMKGSHMGRGGRLCRVASKVAQREYDHFRLINATKPWVAVPEGGEGWLRNGVDMGSAGVARKWPGARKSLAIPVASDSELQIERILPVRF
jgi:hypothetical protein